MPAFDISPSTHQVDIEPGGTGRLVFTIANQIDRRVIARADLEAADPNAPNIASWLSVEGGKRERPFDEKAAETYTVLIAPPAEATPPPGTEPGRYLFRLRMVTTSESASEFTDVSEPIAVVLHAAPAPPPPPDPKPVVVPPKRNIWRFVALGLSLLVAVELIATVGLVISRAGKPVDCSAARLTGGLNDGEFGGFLSRNQTTFEVGDSEEVCITELWVNLPAEADGVVTLRHGDGDSRLDVAALRLTANGESVFVELPSAMGTSAGGTIEVDYSECEDCQGVTILFEGVRFDTSGADS